MSFYGRKLARNEQIDRRFMLMIIILSLGVVCPCPGALYELWTIWTLANSALVNSDPKKFGPRPLVNSDPDPWSIWILFYWSIRTSKRKILWSIRTFSLGQFGPFPLVNSDLFLWLIRTFSIDQFGPLNYVFSIKKTTFRLKTSLQAKLTHY